MQLYNREELELVALWGNVCKLNVSCWYLVVRVMGICGGEANKEGEVGWTVGRMRKESGRGFFFPY